MLVNIYNSDVSKTKSRQYGYADDLALCYSHSHKCWRMLEETLTSDLLI